MGREIYIRVSAFVCILLGLGVAGGIKLSGQSTAPETDRFQPEAGVHVTHAQPGSGSWLSNRNELSAEPEPASPPPPTRSTFMATWDRVSGAKGYLLDVSTTNSFTTYLDGYRELDIGDVAGRLVTGLNRGTTYYYRVRPYNAAGAGNYSVVKTATTVPTVGLVIHPTFDSSITNNPNAAAIQATINRAISYHESLFADPITVQIRFRYSTTTPDGHPLPMGTLAQTEFVIYPIPWSTYIGALRA